MLNDILNKIKESYIDILGDSLVGIYVHGSISFGCFSYETSDIDFIAVVRERPSLNQKVKLISFLLDITPIAPPKGIEMSLVLLEESRHFKYPTPYELHFSHDHIDKFKNDLEGACEMFQSVDYDLAAHFTVINKVGIVLCGDDISRVFGEVRWEYYIDSISRDITDAEIDIASNPVYIILNLCRVLAAVKERLVLSKEQGGLWALSQETIVPRIAPLIKSALSCYEGKCELKINSDLTADFITYMKQYIFSLDLSK